MTAPTILEVGQVFHHLTVVSRAESENGKATWNCICACGNTRTALGSRLVSGKTKSCGCVSDRKGSPTHGLSQAGWPEYRVWVAMRGRCTNLNNPSYDRYGGRGITVCKAWDDFTTFITDMGRRPEGTSIEREDNNLGYSPENCSWATLHQQGRNKRNNRHVEYQGETLTITDFARKIGNPTGLVFARVNRGWSPEKIATTPTGVTPATKVLKEPNE